MAGHAGTIALGSHNLLFNTPNQQFTITYSGLESARSMDFYLQVSDGGADNGGVMAGPVITGIDVVTGTAFATNNTGQSDLTVHPLIRGVHVETSSGTGPLGGKVLATVTIDTTNMAPDVYTLSAVNVGAGLAGGPYSTHLFGSTGNDLNPLITSGSITVLSTPEPASGALLALAGLALFRRRRVTER